MKGIRNITTGSNATSIEFKSVKNTGTITFKEDYFNFDKPIYVNEEELTHTTINNRIGRLSSSAVISGMELSINADNSKFDVSSGIYEIVDNFTDPENPVITTVIYPGSTANTITNLATANVTYVSVDINSNIIQNTSVPVGETLRDYPEIGVVTHPNKTTITSVDSRTSVPAASIAASIADFSASVGVINSYGNIYSPNGANLKLNKSAGSSFYLGINSPNSNKNPNITTDAAGTAITFVYEWRDGAGGTQTYISDTIQPAWYDDNTVGSTTHPNGVVGSNKWTIMPIRYYPASGYTVIDAGQALYNSEAEAEAGIKDSVEVFAVASGSIRAWVLVRGGATDLSDIGDAIFVLAGKFGESATGAGTGISTTTLQQAYTNSTTPEILTDSTLGALSIKRGSAADTDNIIEGLNGAGDTVFNVTGEGILSSIETSTGDLSVTGIVEVSSTGSTGVDSTANIAGIFNGYRSYNSNASGRANLFVYSVNTNDATGGAYVRCDAGTSLWTAGAKPSGYFAINSSNDFVDSAVRAAIYNNGHFVLGETTPTDDGTNMLQVTGNASIVGGIKFTDSVTYGLSPSDTTSNIHIKIGDSTVSGVNALGRPLLIEADLNARLGLAVSNSLTSNDAGIFVSQPSDAGANNIKWDNFTASASSGKLTLTVGNQAPIDMTSSAVNLNKATTVTGDLTVESGPITLKETTTPTAVTDYGKIYTKNDNKLYFQDGAGVEHEIAFV